MRRVGIGSLLGISLYALLSGTTIAATEDRSRAGHWVNDPGPMDDGEKFCGATLAWPDGKIFGFRMFKNRMWVMLHKPSWQIPDEAKATFTLSLGNDHPIALQAVGYRGTDLFSELVTQDTASAFAREVLGLNNKESNIQDDSGTVTLKIGFASGNEPKWVQSIQNSSEGMMMVTVVTCYQKLQAATAPSQSSESK